MSGETTTVGPDSNRSATCLRSQLLHDMAGPIVGHSNGASQLSTPDVPLERHLTIWQEARAVADQARTRR